MNQSVQHYAVAELAALDSSKRKLLISALMVGGAGLSWADEQAPKHVKNALRILCYHDIRDRLRQSFETSPNSAAVSTTDLVEHFEWLKTNGYKVVSLEQMLQARQGGLELPAKAILLTFDDGYESFYSRVYPLLKAYQYPAVMALVEQFMTADATGKVTYDSKLTPRENFLNWDQVREMAKSGLVEFASHSAYSHTGVLANPQGSKLPALVTRIYDPATATYETEEVYATRIYQDFDSVASLMQREIGVRPRAVVWPYGAYNDVAITMARKAGHTVGFNLTSNSDNAATPLMHLGRDLVVFNAGLSGLTSSGVRP